MPLLSASISILAHAALMAAPIEHPAYEPDNVANTVSPQVLMFGSNMSALYAAIDAENESPLEEIAVSRTRKRFNGFYVGVDAGLNRNQLALGDQNSSLSGFTFGFHGGHRYQWDNGLVLGVDATFGKIAGSPSAFRVDDGSLFREVEHNYNAASELQLGFVYGDTGRNLFYFGFGYNHFQQTVFNPDGGRTVMQGNDLQYSLGFEWSLSDSFRLRFNTTLGGETNLNGLSTRSTVGLSFRF